MLASGFLIRKALRLPVDIFALLPDLLEFVLLNQPLLFVLLVGSADRAQHLLVHFSELALDPVLLEVAEHIFKFLLVEDTRRRHL